jgi:hypothetical protein
MKKFEKVIELKGSILNYNKFDKFIFGEFEGRLYGDWGVYDDGEERGYDFDLMKKNDDDDFCYIDDVNYDLEDKDKVLLKNLKEYVGEGICYDSGGGNNDWYNVKFVGDIMEISFIN